MKRRKIGTIPVHFIPQIVLIPDIKAITVQLGDVQLSINLKQSIQM